MEDHIKVADIYDKSLSFLIGSGASVGLLPTLALKIKDEIGLTSTIEELATRFEKQDARFDWLFAHYYKTCIRPAQIFRPEDANTEDKKKVLSNYEVFTATLLRILQKRKALDRRCNVFTTNYDSCFFHAADALIRKGEFDFHLNDGTRGFRTRYLHARNFNSYLCQAGVFDKGLSGIPQINLINLHGSIYWKKVADSIVVDYGIDHKESYLPDFIIPDVEAFSDQLYDPNNDVDNLTALPMPPHISEAFWKKYRALPIVNPTKWKFNETVFEEHYYQMLRYLTYELEKPNSVLISFGFSFADEHILNLIKRSLSNPTLQVFICCYSVSEHSRLAPKFKLFANVKFIVLADNEMSFTEFNESVFNIQRPTQAISLPGVV
ncbi:hypothetical protein ACCQ07_05380 [Xanthomonas sp. NCPPB 3583]|uniref:hypothetical protein n=1 Tax=Xanthomonas sp. NCPPB 3583 TaxID=487558 RepID=UPI0035576F96